MAKKSAKQTTKAETVQAVAELPDISKLDVPSLNALIGAARTRVEEIDVDTKAQRIKAFKASDAYKKTKEKVKDLKVRIKEFFKKNPSFTCTISFSGNAREGDWASIDGIVFGDDATDDFFEYDFSAGEVTGKGLTTEQKSHVESALEGFVSGICSDGAEIFFPKLKDEADKLNEELQQLQSVIVEELEKHALDHSDVFED